MTAESQASAVLSV